MSEVPGVHKLVDRALRVTPSDCIERGFGQSLAPS